MCNIMEGLLLLSNQWIETTSNPVFVSIEKIEEELISAQK